VISLRGVSVSFGTKAVFDGLDWELPEAGVYLVLGANSSGKSVLLDVIGGRRKPKSGEVMLSDVPVYKLFAPDLPRIEYLRREATADEADALWGAYSHRLRQCGSREVPHDLLNRLALPWTEAEMRKLRMQSLPQGELLEFELLCAMSLIPKFLLIDDYFSRFSFTACERVASNLSAWHRLSGGTVVATSVRYFGFMEAFDGVFALEGGKLRKLTPRAVEEPARNGEPPAEAPREVLIVCGEFFYRHSRAQQDNEHLAVRAVLENALLVEIKTTLDGALGYLRECGIDIVSVSFAPRMDAQEYGQGVFF
jgi:ABC-type multidrug transport system ATPase subunit